MQSLHHACEQYLIQMLQYNVDELGLQSQRSNRLALCLYSRKEKADFEEFVQHEDVLFSQHLQAKNLPPVNITDGTICWCGPTQTVQTYFVKT